MERIKTATQYQQSALFIRFITKGMKNKFLDAIIPQTIWITA